MHHAASQDFQPARLLANRASGAATNKTLHIHFGRWFREWKVICAKTRPHILAEHSPREIDQRPFQVGKGDILADHESFHLVELDLGTRRDLLIAKAHS